MDGTSFELATRINEPHFGEKVEPIFAIVADRNSNRFVTLGFDGIVRFWAPKIRQQDGLTVTSQDGQALISWSCNLAVPIGESARSRVKMLSSGLKGIGIGVVLFASPTMGLPSSRPLPAATKASCT